MEQRLTNEVLLNALEERYTSIRSVRDRVQSITLRILGILLGVSGWIIQSKVQFCCNEKMFFIIVIFISAIIIYGYFEDLKKGVNKQRDIASAIENKLGFFEGEDSIYPKSRKQKNENRPFLKYHYIMLIFGFIVLIISILFFT